ncbi:MAG: amino acid ABC transporter permease [Thermoleophilia bacterium]|nr:amino acid ABC transporter permease [Thermoleophilia bacterium]
MSASPRDPGPAHATVGPATALRPAALGLGARVRRNSALIASVSTIAVLAAIVLFFATAPGARAFQRAFLSPDKALESARPVLSGFVINLELMVAAEALVLAFALLIAVARGLPGAAAFPLRLLAVAYTDFFRGVPLVLVVFAVGLGVPALGIQVLYTDNFFVYGLVSLVLVYSAYVAEVYRAGIESVHESQIAAARSLSLSHFQSLRYVVLPQAVRRVVPPLLNDFIGLQKDTALVSFIGVLEAFRRAQDHMAATFNFTALTVTAVFFVALTIPLARVTDWLVERDRRKMRALGG